MLPDISKRRKLYGMALKDFDRRQLHAIIDPKNNDGCTTKNCVEILRRMNGYLEESRYLVIETSAVFYFMKALYEGEFQDVDSVVLRTYNDYIDRGFLGSSMRNIMRVTKSIASQRRLVKAVSKSIKINKVNKDWEELLNKFLDGLEGRIKYVSEIVVPANIKHTPMAAYMDYLERNGMDIFEDIRIFIENSGGIYDEDDKSVEIYKEHVLSILCSIDNEVAEALVEKVRTEMDVWKQRVEHRAAEREASRIMKAAAETEECRAIVLGLCSRAGKDFRTLRKRSLNYSAKRTADAWVVAAAAIKPGKRTGYLKCSGSGKFSISKVENATIFNSQEKAVEAAMAFREAGEARIAEVAKIELYDYGIGIL